MTHRRKLTDRWRVLYEALLSTCFMMVSSLADSSTLKTEVTCSFEVYVDFQWTSITSQNTKLFISYLHQLAGFQSLKLFTHYCTLSDSLMLYSELIGAIKKKILGTSRLNKRYGRQNPRLKSRIQFYRYKYIQMRTMIISNYTLCYIFGTVMQQNSYVSFPEDVLLLINYKYSRTWL